MNMANNKILVFTVGLGVYIKAAKRLVNALVQLDMKDYQLMLVDQCLLRSVAEEAGFKSNGFSSDKRGFGFWTWKPLLISYFLDQGYRSIVYLDAGCEINPEMLKNTIYWFEHDSPAELLLSRTYHSISDYTKPSVISFFQKQFNLNVDVSKVEMSQCSVILTKNTSDVSRFFAEVSELIKFEDGFLFNDKKLNDDKGFIDHRHDQSVINLLLLSSDLDLQVGVIDSSLTPPAHKEGWGGAPPIIAARNVSYASYYNLLLRYGEKRRIPYFYWLIVKIKRLLISLSFGSKGLLSVFNKYPNNDRFNPPKVIRYPIEMRRESE